MMNVVTFCLIALGLPYVFGQSTPSSSDTSTDSEDDIFSLNDEDFKLWIAGRSPKAWETSTRSVSTTTPSTTTSTDNPLFDQFNSFDQTTTSIQEAVFTTRNSQETTPKTDFSSDTGVNLYQRPNNLPHWLQTQMLQSHQINHQLMTNVGALPYPHKSVGSSPGCNPASEAHKFRPASASFQTLATIHHFNDNSPPQQLPFPGNSHHGDAFLSQNQNQQKPPQQQQQIVRPQPSPAPVNHRGEIFTSFDGNTNYFRRPSLRYLPAAVETPPLVYGYY